MVYSSEAASAGKHPHIGPILQSIIRQVVRTPDNTAVNHVSHVLSCVSVSAWLAPLPVSRQGLCHTYSVKQVLGILAVVSVCPV